MEDKLDRFEVFPKESGFSEEELIKKLKEKSKEEIIRIRDKKFSKDKKVVVGIAIVRKEDSGDSKDLRSLPFWNEKLLTEIGGEKIEACNSVLLSEDGKVIAGEVKIADPNPRDVPFIGDRLLKEIEGEKVLSTLNLRLSPDGNVLAGIVKVDKDLWYPFLGEKLFKNLHEVYRIELSPDGEMISGITSLPDGRSVPFIADFRGEVKVLERVGKAEIKKIREFHLLPDKKLFLSVEFSNKKKANIIWDGKETQILRRINE